MKTIPLTLAALLLMASPAHADTPLRAVSVDGRGSVSAAPDMARVSMAVEARDLDMDAARDEVVRVTRAFLELCERSGIEPSKIQTTGLGVFPEYRWNEIRKEQELVAYRVTRQLDVEIVDLDILGDLMEAAVDAGVNRVSPPNLMSTRERDLRREALALAARDAQANARVLAETLGADLGDVVDISSAEQVMPPPMLRNEAFSLAAGADAGQTYSSGEIRFEASVTARFELNVE